MPPAHWSHPGAWVRSLAWAGGRWLPTAMAPAAMAPATMAPAAAPLRPPRAKALEPVPRPALTAWQCQHRGGCASPAVPASATAIATAPEVASAGSVPLRRQARPGLGCHQAQAQPRGQGDTASRWGVGMAPLLILLGAPVPVSCWGAVAKPPVPPRIWGHAPSSHRGWSPPSLRGSGVAAPYPVVLGLEPPSC